MRETNDDVAVTMMGDTPVPSEADRILGEVAGEFFDRLARGEQPQIEYYAEKFPQIADLIRETIPAIDLINDSASSRDASAVGSHATPQLGDFRIIKELGRGGMGVVYEAEQLSMGRKVALKVLPFAGLVDSKMLHRFKNEVRAAATLEHPNIVPVYSIGAQRGVHFFAMRLIHGQSLAAVIAELARFHDSGAPLDGNSFSDMRSAAGGLESESSANQIAPDNSTSLNGPVDDAGMTNRGPEAYICTFGRSEHQASFFRSAAKLGVQAADAIQHADENGVLHRDIKPGNLMLDEEGNLHVTDFGLARIEADAGITMTGDMVGTLRYMSPEQTLGKNVVADHRTDIYSLGVTLYELFTLRPPFSGDDRQELLRQIALESAPKLRKINRSIPAELQTIVLKAMEKEPDHRYATARELADDLQAFLDDRSIRAKPPTLIRRAAKWSRRHRALVRTAVATMAVAVVVASFLLSRERSRTLAALKRETQQHKLAVRQRIVTETQRRETNQLLYVSDMKLASDALRAGDVPRVASLVNRHRPAKGEPDLRDFTWHYLDKSVNLPCNWTRDLKSPINDLALSPDEQMVCAALQNGQLRVYRVTSGELLQTFVSLSKVNAVSWAPSGQSIISAGADGYIRVWDFNDKSAEIDESYLDSAVRMVTDQIAPSRSFAAHEGEANSLCVTPDSQHIVSCGEDGKIGMWDSVTGTQVAVLEGHQRAVEQIALSPDGTLLASASSDETLVLWNLKTRSQIKSWESPHFGRMVSVDFSPDGSCIAGGDVIGILVVIDLITQVQSTAEQLDGIESVQFLGDSRLVATGSRGGAINVWNTPRQQRGLEPLPPIPITEWASHRGRVQSLAQVSSSRTLLSASRDGSLSSWSPRYDLTRKVFSYGDSFAIGNDSTLLSCDQDIYIYNLGQRSLVSQVNLNDDSWDLIASASNCPHVVTADSQGTVAVLNCDSRTEVSRWRVGYDPYRITISLCGKIVAVADWEERRQVEVFDVQNPSNPRIISALQCECIVFSPDSRLLAVGSMDDLLIYDLDQGGSPIRLAGHDSTLTDASFSPNGKTIATVSGDRRLKLWDVATGAEIKSAQAHLKDIDCVDFSTDGNLIVTGGKDWVARIWDAQTLSPMLAIETQERIKQITLPRMIDA